MRIGAKVPPASLALDAVADGVVPPGQDQWAKRASGGPLTDDHREDPLDRADERWLAGFAPVGRTPLAVIVQTREDVAMRSNELLADRLVFGSAVALAVGAFIALVLFFAARRRR